MAPGQAPANTRLARSERAKAGGSLALPLCSKVSGLGAVRLNGSSGGGSGTIPMYGYEALRLRRETTPCDERYGSASREQCSPDLVRLGGPSSGPRCVRGERQARPGRG